MFRILALDGGGIKGTFTAAILTELERQTGCRLADHFDLMVGTSTGGILALGLALGIKASALLDLYVKRGADIFPSLGFLGAQRGMLRQLFRPKLRQEDLRTVLTEYIGEKRLGDAAVPLVIASYEAVRGRPYLFKTAHHPNHSRDYRASAVDVALATSAAPTFFRAAAVAVRKGESYFDGGVWANSPTMVGIAEAVAFFGVPLSEIDVLSIGTTDEVRSFSHMREAGMLKWNVGLVDILMSAQADAARAQSALLLDGRMLRIDMVRPSGTYSLDRADAQTIGELAALGEGKAAERQVVEQVKARFLNGQRAERYTPLHS